MTVNYPYLENNGTEIGLAHDGDGPSEFTKAVSDEERAKALELLHSAPAISLHEHPTRLPDPLEPEPWAWYRGASRAYHGFDGIRASGNSAFFVNAWSFASSESVVKFLGRARADIAHHDGVFAAETVADLDRTIGGGGDEVALYLSLESATAFADDLDSFEMLYGFGVRMAGLCYNDGNAFGMGLAAEDNDEGLTAHGRDFLRLASALGMIVDLGHVGDKTSLDVIEASDKPVVISHAGARALWNTWRMKPDTVLKALAEKGGVLGISAAPNTTRSTNNQEHSIHSIVDHINYAVDLMGIDHVGLGPDTFFGDHAGIHRLGRGDGAWSSNHSGRNIGELSPFVDGVENPRENFVNIAVILQRDGWSNDDILKVLGGNARRVMTEVFGK